MDWQNSNVLLYRWYGGVVDFIDKRSSSLRFEGISLVIIMFDSRLLCISYGRVYYQIDRFQTFQKEDMILTTHNH